jgi:hypothetical protein
MIGKQHFTLLYDRARRKAMTSRNIISGWSKTGLRPFNPDRVLKDIQKPDTLKYCTLIVDGDKDSLPLVHHPETPKTYESLASLRRDIEMNIAESKVLDARTKLSIQKVANAAENAFADRAILLDENMLLFEQNNEKTTRTSIKATVVGTAKVLSYEDIVEAQQKRDTKEAEAAIVRGRRTSKRNKATPSSQGIGKRSRSHEREEAIDEIRASGMEKYCSVLKF